MYKVCAAKRERQLQGVLYYWNVVDDVGEESADTVLLSSGLEVTIWPTGYEAW
jgi:hypothetical protein